MSISERDKVAPSDIDEVAYSELMKESAKTGKKVEQILAERQGKIFTVDKNKTGKMAEEVRKALAENSWGWQVKPKEEQEENNEQ